MDYKITLSNNTMICEPGLNIVDISQIFCAALVSAVNNIVYPSDMPEEDILNIRKEIFDDMNLIFSRTLDEAFPEIALRPELTEQAIMEMENKLIEKAAMKS